MNNLAKLNITNNSIIYLITLQLHTEVTHKKEVKAEEKYSVSLSPNVDKAFVSALLIIREEVRKSRYKGYES